MGRDRMTKLETLIYEDESQAADSWAERVRHAYPAANVKTIRADGFLELIQVVNCRRLAWRRDGNEGCAPESHDADRADLIIVDYDLLSYSDEGDTTGSRLAYLLRCYTDCGFIVVLNAFGPNVFDMSLGTPAQDFADLHIGDAQLGNPGLWEVPFDGYRPWYWPLLPSAKTNFEQCVSDVRANLSAPILDFLGLRRVIDWIPHRAHDFLSGKQKLGDLTFLDFVQSSRGGIAAKDRLTDGQVARVAAARLVTLLNLVILPEQSALVDAPHLVSRFPSLLRGEGDIGTWNRLCHPVAETMEGLLDDLLEKHRFEKPHWLWRPAWYWPDINRDEEISEVKDPWTVHEVQWVFCEDISSFVPLEVAQDFRAVISPPFIKRFLFNSDAPGAVAYVRQIGDGGPQDPSQVDYVPDALSW